MEVLVLLILASLLSLVMLGLCVVVYRVLRQQGRLLLRLEAIEEGLSQASNPTLLPMMAGNGHRQPPQGLAIGAAPPPFRLPDLSGRMVSLEDFRGRRVLLVHWNPGCGFCVLIAPELAEFQGDLRDRNTELVLISNGDLEANRRLAQEHGLDCLILLQHDGGRLEAFQQLGTPVAYLLDEEGLVAAPLAIGAEQVPVLARKAVAGAKRLPGQRPLSQSRIEREGLKAGTPAPRFALPDVYGTPVTLEGLRGQRVLLVFSDPQCGPCATLVPELVRLHRAGRDNGLAVVMVGRGEVADNRRMVKEHGIDFPVVVQEKWRLSREYGIFATPVAFLIDQDGVIVRDVARGAEEIVGLARDAVTGPETEVSRNKMG